MRFFNKLYAHIFGYFWIPCPLCHKMFGGHEWSRGNTLKSSQFHGQAVCDKCGESAKNLNQENGYGQ